MAASPTAGRFGPDAQRRRQQKAEKKERLHAAARAAVDVQGVPPIRDRVLDGAEELATKRATAAVEKGRPLRWHEDRQVRREALEAQRSGVTTTGKQQPKPSLRDRLERMSEQERLDVLGTIRGEREYAYVERLIESIAYEDAEAEYLAAVGNEEASIAEIDTAAESDAWSAEQDTASEEQREAFRVRRLEAESAELTEQEQRAAEDLAAATAGPLYLGGEELFDEEGEAE